MAEKIKIFELDIDVDGAITASKEFAKEADVLKNKLKELKDSGDTTSREYVELEARYKSVRKEYNSSQNELGKLINLQGKEIKTIDQGRAALSVVSKEWAKQANLYGVNSAEADKLAKKKTELTATLKDLESQTGDNRRNVGNYAEGMKEALGETTLFGRAQSLLTDVMNIVGPVFKAVKSDVLDIGKSYKEGRAQAQAFSGTQKAVAIATNLSSTALKLFKVALIATGIGAIVVLLGSLVAMFTRTQKGIDMVNTVLAALSAGADVVIDRLSKLGGAFIKIISGDIKGGFKDLTETFSGMGDEIQREINLAMELERVLQNVERAEINLDIRRSAANSRLKELKLLTDDTTRSTEDRISSAKEYMKIERDLAAEEVKNQEKKVAALLGYAEVTDEVRETIRKIGEEGVSLDQLGLSESTVEDMKSFRDEATKLYDLQSQSFERQTEQQNKLNSLVDQQRAKEKAAAEAAKRAQEERIAEAQKATDAAIAESKTRLELFIEENKREAESLAEKVALQEQVREKRLEILKDELAAKKLTQSEYELAVLQTKNEFLDQEAELTKEYAQKEIEAEKERLAAMQELEAVEKERKLADLENQMAVDQENFDARMELEKQRLDMMRQQELAEAEKTGASKALINQKYAEIEKQINYEKESTKRKQSSETFGQVAKLLGEQTVAGKAAALAQAAINTYQGVTEVWRAPSVLPEPFGTIQKVVSTGTVLASGLGAVQKITSINANVPKAARGITLRGKRHSEGGERLYDESGNPIVEAEGGENIYVINRRASQLINGLSAVNEATGGIPLSQTANYAAAGGMIKRSGSTGPVKVNSQPIDYSAMAQATAEAVKNVRIYTAVTEINDGQGKYATIVNEANI
ncbi:hypothetical protein SAMN06296241_1365 [Salinimicrobium sediminis]|uniref:Chromosome segregation ATPase n=1 Tax=Salinimicrobium sediminis TaxID=1343891 RepID=A0A285X3G7_9FLAO|nr:hypothetical protein [Salinimicrobium sediminis]SOC79828.1 hypothetical protein SAMN06296241_1365 [Salinimicrobium sediminis]